MVFEAQMEGVSELRITFRLEFVCVGGWTVKFFADRWIDCGSSLEVLRTRFVFEEGEVRQQIGDVEESSFLLLEHDLRQHVDGQRGVCERLVSEEARTEFSLEGRSADSWSFDTSRRCGAYVADYDAPKHCV